MGHLDLVEKASPVVLEEPLLISSEVIDYRSSPKLPVLHCL